VKDNTVKRTLASGGMSFGTMVFEFSTTGFSRVAAQAGAEFACFDMEHTGWSMETIRMLMSTGRSADIVPLVRVPADDHDYISRVLDLGALGVMVPMVESEEEARHIVSCTRYPPAGARGFGLLYRDDYENDNHIATMAKANREIMVIAQIETKAGVEEVEQIAAVDGVDVLWIGHYDLTNSLGVPGRFTDKLFTEALQRVLDAAAAHGKTAGIMAGAPADAVRHVEAGFRAIAFSDMGIYEAGLRSALETARVAAG
jgi:2-dehydro-3-deoxyglucarate aldolase/4-hydroxy-2-oxoheptanedioate aldolase